MLDKGTVINTVERYTEAVTREFSPSAIILFGSYVNGNPHEDSDIDVGVKQRRNYGVYGVALVLILSRICLIAQMIKAVL